MIMKWSKAMEQVEKPALVTIDEWNEIRSAIGPHCDKFGWDYAQTKRHHILYGTFRGGLLGFFTRFSWKVKSFLIIVEKKSVIRVRVNVSHP